MKKAILVLSSVLVIAGCESMRHDRDDNKRMSGDIKNEGAGSESQMNDQFRTSSPDANGHSTSTGNSTGATTDRNSDQYKNSNTDASSTK